MQIQMEVSCGLKASAVRQGPEQSFMQEIFSGGHSAAMIVFSTL